MYYLDFHSLHKRTTKEQRALVRKTLHRNEIMEYKLKLQRNHCFYCYVDIDMSGHLDHVVPIYWGGVNRISNLVASCRSCNLTKMTDHLEITNPYTIKDYLNLIKAKKKYDLKCKLLNVKRLKHIPKRVQLYRVYNAHLFKSI